jgi:hypothetical protein
MAVWHPRPKAALTRPSPLVRRTTYLRMIAALDEFMMAVLDGPYWTGRYILFPAESPLDGSRGDRSWLTISAIACRSRGLVTTCAAVSC